MTKERERGGDDTREREEVTKEIGSDEKIGDDERRERK